MDPQEKYLYHQIHPLKLMTDWGTGIAALYPLWQHNLIPALLVMLIPPPIVSFLLIRFADLEKQKASAFGQYVRNYMTRQVESFLRSQLKLRISLWGIRPSTFTKQGTR